MFLIFISLNAGPGNNNIENVTVTCTGGSVTKKFNEVWKDLINDDSESTCEKLCDALKKKVEADNFTVNENDKTCNCVFKDSCDKFEKINNSENEEPQSSSNTQGQKQENPESGSRPDLI